MQNSLSVYLQIAIKIIPIKGGKKEEMFKIAKNSTRNILPLVRGVRFLFETDCILCGDEVSTTVKNNQVQELNFKRKSMKSDHWG